MNTVGLFNLEEELAQIEAAAAYLRGLAAAPAVALTLGSGLNAVLAALEEVKIIEYSDIPGFPLTSAPGHKSQLWLARLGGVPLAVLTGRFHQYEGRTPWEVAFPVRVMAAWGVKNLILTNAAGSVNPDFAPVSLMLISDHIALFAQSALRGPNFDRFGARFPDQGNVYDRELRACFRDLAAEEGVTLHEGVYFYTRGPVYETPAEIRMIRILGADAVGMSTVTEAQAAVHSGLRVLGVCCLSNWGAGMKDEILSSDEVIAAGRLVGGDLARLLARFLSTLV